MKKNSQYYRKRRVMSALHPKSTEKAILAYRMTIQTVLGAMQMTIMLSTPKPKYPSGGAVVGESGPEIVCTDDRFKDAKAYLTPLKLTENSDFIKPTK